MSRTNWRTGSSATLMACALTLTGYGCDSLSRALDILPATGQLELRTTTEGSNLDPDGYEVRVRSDEEDDRVESMRINDILVLSLVVGSRTVSLEGVAPNCSVETSPQVVTVPENSRVIVPFRVTCS